MKKTFIALLLATVASVFVLSAADASLAATRRGGSAPTLSQRRGPGGPGPGFRPGGHGPGFRPGGPGFHRAPPPHRFGPPGPGPRRFGPPGPPPRRWGPPGPPPRHHYYGHRHHHHDDALAVGGAMFLLGAILAGSSY